MMKPTPITLPTYKTPAPYGGSTWRWLMFFISPYRAPYLTALTLNLARQSFFRCQPLLLGLLIGWAGTGAFHADPTLAARALGTYFCLMIMVFATLLYLLPLASKTMDRIAKTATLFSFRHYLSLSERWHENRASGEKLQRLLKARESIFSLLEESLWQLLQCPAILISIGISLYVLDASPIYVPLFLGMMGSYIYLSFISAQWVQRRFADFYKTQETVVGGVYEFLVSTATVRFFNLTRHILGKAEGLETLNHQSRIKIAKTSAIRWCIISTCATFWLVLIGGIATHQVIEGTLSVAGYSTILFLSFTIWIELEGIALLYTRLIDYWEGFKRLTEVLNQKPAITDSASAETFHAEQVEIKFENIGFHYTEEKAIIHDLSLTIAAGEKIGLIGPSGAGKSTIIKLLMRFYDAQTGNVYLNNHNLKAITSTSLQDHIAVIPQDVTLFNHPLIENIRYGRLNATDEEVFEAARKANAHEFILDLPDGYQTLVGERGVKLSGGQRQRIAIARAILKNAPVLVLDEATSALDSESEKLIQNSLQELMKGKTVIAIAHRLSTIAHLDRLIVMENGHIAETGTHQQLIEKNGLYARLWSMQSGGFLKE